MTPQNQRSTPRFETFEAFWPYYLAQHSHPLNRLLHIIGTTLALALLVALGAVGAWAWMGLAAVVGYGMAWVGHFCVEKNRPATFGHVLYSLRGDGRMWLLAWTGRLGKELELHGLCR